MSPFGSFIYENKLPNFGGSMLKTKWGNLSYYCCVFPDLLDAGDDRSQFVLVGNLNSDKSLSNLADKSIIYS